MKHELHIIAISLVAPCAFALIGGSAFAQEPLPLPPEPMPGAAETAPPVEPAPAAAPAVEPTPAPTPPPKPAEAVDEKAGREISSDEEGGDDGLPIGSSKSLKIGGRVHAGYRLVRKGPTPISLRPQSTVDESKRDTSNEFEVKRARLKVSWRPERWMLAVVQLDVAEALELGGSILRDAYVHFSPLDQLQLRVGQFKKPFSGMELQSPGKLKVIERGPGVNYIAEDLLYGDRDLGLQLSGRLVKAVKLDYEIGVFNGSGPDIDEMDNSKDLVARMQIQPIKQLELGANLSAKFFSDPSSQQPAWALAAGGDSRVGIKGFRFFAEALVAADHTAYKFDTSVIPENTPNAFAVLAMASYRQKFKAKVRFALEPVFKAELFDPNSKYTDDIVWVLTPGINAYLGQYFKLMLDGEFVRSDWASPAGHPDSETIEVLACFDI
jgi:hypothetical protein